MPRASRPPRRQAAAAGPRDQPAILAFRSASKASTLALSITLVGFYSYNPPRIYEALQAAGTDGAITVIAFDEDPITLGAVRAGEFAGTVVQQPYEWGYQGMKLMATYLGGDKSMVPEDGLIIVPTKVIDKANVDAFEADLKAKIAG